METIPEAVFPDNQPEEAAQPKEEAPGTQPMEVEATPTVSPLSEPTEGKLSLTAVGDKIVRVVDDLNLRTGAIIEVTKEGQETDPSDPTKDAKVAPEYHDRTFVYTTRSERYLLRVPKDLPRSEFLRRLQEQ
eukprot:10076328-Alexandrium_andersonii.AAC.1